MVRGLRNSLVAASLTVTAQPFSLYCPGGTTPGIPPQTVAARSLLDENPPIHVSVSMPITGSRGFEADLRPVVPARTRYQDVGMTDQRPVPRCSGQRETCCCAHRTDYAAALREFRWPRLERVQLGARLVRRART